jgi:hypothetical protein
MSVRTRVAKGPRREPAEGYGQANQRAAVVVGVDQDRLADSSSLTPHDEVLTALMRGRGGRRTFVPISPTFLQQRQPGGGAALLASFVNTRRKRALDLWLLAHTIASSPPWDVAFHGGCGRERSACQTTPARACSSPRPGTWLEQLQLIRSERDGSLRRIYLLDDGGRGAVMAGLRHPRWMKKGKA